MLTSSADQSSTAPLTNRVREREEDLDAGPATSIYGDKWWPPRIVAFAKVDEVGIVATRSRKHVEELVGLIFSIFVLHALLSEGQLQLPSCNGRTEARRLVDILWQRLG